MDVIDRDLVLRFRVDHRNVHNFVARIVQASVLRDYIGVLSLTRFFHTVVESPLDMPVVVVLSMAQAYSGLSEHQLACDTLRGYIDTPDYISSRAAAEGFDSPFHCRSTLTVPFLAETSLAHGLFSPLTFVRGIIAGGELTNLHVLADCYAFIAEMFCSHEDALGLYNADAEFRGVCDDVALIHNIISVRVSAVLSSAFDPSSAGAVRARILSLRRNLTVLIPLVNATTSSSVSLMLKTLLCLTDLQKHYRAALSGAAPAGVFADVPAATLRAEFESLHKKLHVLIAKILATYLDRYVAAPADAPVDTPAPALLSAQTQTLALAPASASAPAPAAGRPGPDRVVLPQDNKWNQLTMSSLVTYGTIMNLVNALRLDQFRELHAYDDIAHFLATLVGDFALYADSVQSYPDFRVLLFEAERMLIALADQLTAAFSTAAYILFSYAARLSEIVVEVELKQFAHYHMAYQYGRYVAPLKAVLAELGAAMSLSKLRSAPAVDAAYALGDPFFIEIADRNVSNLSCFAKLNRGDHPEYPAEHYSCHELTLLALRRMAVIELSVGTALFNAKMYVDSVLWLERAVAHCDRLEPAMVALSRAYLNIGEGRRSVEVAARCRTLNPRNITARKYAHDAGESLAALVEHWAVPDA